MDVEVNALLAASLEALIHQLIYAWNVYPSDSFANCTFLGIVGGQRNRHSSVVAYISNCVHVAVPVLRDRGVVVVVVGHERIVLQLLSLEEQNDAHQGDDDLFIVKNMALLESRLRDLILSVHALERRKKKQECFQIQLIPSSSDCQELVQGMTNGQWYQVNKDDPSSSNKGMIRPIFGSGGIALHVLCVHPKSP
mmetsp:Transcript_5832/g.9689  ORF Transcript_5832/g.9689 Transcript_5832/m.9689 type:complete len:195 (-) Transcript_5832:553-1137(-)|eukprot:CAMPEP_0119026832 /NCGR_PEP_ID=MMETSP1176-20130426/36122_1 /TAXON_ID=265551 /ORGANISM="Synedropsis recta cf, Strain CCMP1620" /LENGTH=194 /DNA_ID=CAMNT_0006982637 /DNA_START=80 /DNA_END=664 /DNA_ORIENTATION=-